MLLLRDLVLVRERPREETRESGIYIPAVDEPPDWTWGIVVACGIDVQEVIVGDHVLYHRFMGVETLLDDGRTPALFLRERELAVYDLDRRDHAEDVTEWEIMAEVDRMEAASTGEPVSAHVAVARSGRSIHCADEAAAVAAIRDEVDAETDPLA